MGAAAGHAGGSHRVAPGGQPTASNVIAVQPRALSSASVITVKPAALGHGAEGQDSGAVDGGASPFGAVTAEGARPRPGGALEGQWRSPSCRSPAEPLSPQQTAVSTPASQAAQSLQVAPARSGSSVRSSPAGAGSAAAQLLKQLRLGQQVRVVGLHTAVHLNEKHGVIQAWDQELERWVVRLNGGEECRVRVGNLEPLSPGRVEESPGSRGGQRRDVNGQSARAGEANKELESLLLQTNWSAIYHLFHQRFGVAALDKIERAYVVKAAVEMSLSIVSKCFALLRSDPGGRLHCTPLHIAALQSSVEAAEVIVRDLPKLVAQTHRPSHSALCPLHIAILCGSQGIAELLLEGGADPNVRTLHDVCPLHLAASTSKELCQLLLSYDAEPTRRDVMGSTAMHYATAFKQQGVVEVLLSRCDRLAVECDQKRVSPLHICCALYGAEEDLTGALHLLANGAKPWQTDLSGASAREVVPWNRNSALQQFFERAGDRSQTAAQAALEELYMAQRGGEVAEADGGLEENEASLTVSGEAAGGRWARPATEIVPSSHAMDRRREASLAAEVDRLQKELQECRGQLTMLESLKYDLEHSHQKCAMLEQAAVNQQTVFDDLQALCESARVQHQAQIAEVQKRHVTEKAAWQESLRSRVDAARAEERQDAERRLEELRQELRERVQQGIQQGTLAKTTSKALPTSPKSLMFAGANGQQLQVRVEELQQELERLAAEEEELRGAVRSCCATHGIQLAVGDELADSRLWLAPLDQELGRLRRGDADIKALQEELRQVRAEAAAAHVAHTAAEDRCRELEQKCQQVENKKSSREVKLEAELQKVQLDAAQAVTLARTSVEAMEKRVEVAEAAKEKMEPLVERLNAEVRELYSKYAEEQSIRRKLHNQIQDMKGAIRVYCRFRPLGRHEQEAGDAVAVRKVDAFHVDLQRAAERKSFQFDAVFEDTSTQEEIFADCRDLVQSAVDGYNVTIFAYGQTGAGKTHTMYGSSSDPGLAPRSIQALFEVITREQDRGTKKFKVKMYLVEIYKQEIIDLLAPHPGTREGKKHLEVKRDLGQNMMYVDGATERQVSSPQELESYLHEGEKKRHTAATKMNSHSSRSHLVLGIVIECDVTGTEQVIYGKITLCDLAGSERPKKSEVTGENLKEAIEINKSLSALGDVIEALTKGNKSIPYRNHKLTMLMQDSLGGSAKTLMFVNCSPSSSNVEETQMSLKWATRARHVTNDVRRNADCKEVARLKQVIAMMSQAQNAEGGHEGASMAHTSAGNAAAMRASQAQWT